MRQAGLSPDLYYRDLIEYAVWEDYGLLGPQELAPFFKKIPKADVMLADGVLRELRAELCGAELEYQAENALTLLGALHVNKRRFDLFEELARQMGSRHWERITTMAECAHFAGHRDLARAVFAAADQPGMHRDYLRQQCRRAFSRLQDLPAARARRISESSVDGNSLRQTMHGLIADSDRPPCLSCVSSRISGLLQSFRNPLNVSRFPTSADAAGNVV